MKIQTARLCVLCAFAFILAGCNNDAAPTGDVRDNELPAQRMERLRAEAPVEMLTTCSNEVIGFQRLVEFHIFTSDHIITNWQGDVTADFVNGIGGVNRTNILYRFGAAGGHIYAIQDWEAMYQRDTKAIESRN